MLESWSNFLNSRLICSLISLVSTNELFSTDLLLDTILVYVNKPTRKQQLTSQGTLETQTTFQQVANSYTMHKLNRVLTFYWKKKKKRK